MKGGGEGRKGKWMKKIEEKIVKMQVGSRSGVRRSREREDVKNELRCIMYIYQLFAVNVMIIYHNMC